LEPEGLLLDRLLKEGLLFSLPRLNDLSIRLDLFLDVDLGLLLEKIGKTLDDVLDGVVFEHHFLMVAVALGGSSGLYGITHEDVDFYLFSLSGRKLEKFHVSLQEVDVFSLFSLAP
jgi:hypothetical protein